MREQENFEQGLEYSTNRMKAALEELSSDFLKSDFLKGLIDTGTKFIEILDKIISHFGTLQTLLIGIGTVIGSKHLGLFNYDQQSGFSASLSNTIFGIFKNSKQELSGDQTAYAELIHETMNETVGDTDLAVAKVRELNDGMGDLSVETRSWGMEVAKSGKGFESADEACNQLNKSLGQGVSIGGKLQGIFGKLGATLANIGIGFAASMLVNGAIWLVDELIETDKEIEEASEKAKQNVNETTETLKKQKSTVNDVKDRYAELAQGVKNLGTIEQSQGELSNDEYQEFLDISNQLAELFPTLSAGYDDNGNAILNLSGDVDTIVGSLENLVDVEKEAAAFKVSDQMGDIWKNYAKNVNKSKDQLKQWSKEASTNNGEADNADALEVYRQWKNTSGQNIKIDSETDTGKYFQNFIWDKLNDRRKNAGKEMLEMNDYRKEENGSVFYDFSSLDDETKKEIDGLFSSIINNYKTDVKKAKNAIDAQNKEMGEYVAQISETFTFDRELSDKEQKIMENYIRNFDFSKLLEKNGDDWNKAYDEFYTILNNTFGSLTEADAAMLNKYYNDIFAIDLSEDAYGENVEKVKQFAHSIAEILGEEISDEDILNALGFGNLDDKLDAAKERLQSSKFGRNSQKAKQELNEWAGTLSSDELDLLMTIDIDEYSSLEELKKALAEMQKEADAGIDVEIKSSDAVDSMADMKSALSSLDSLYSQTVKMEAADGQATGYADPALINSVESSFSKFSKTLEDAGDKEGAASINYALEEFEDTLVKFPNDATKAQSAMDNLITAYLDQTDAIKNLTEENKEWSIAQLEAMGVTNAQEVVESRLNKIVKATIKNISALSKALNTYKDALEGTDEAKKAEAFKNLAASVQDTLKVYDSEGNEITDLNGFKVTEGFVKAHLEDIEAMATGDEEALSRVRLAAAKGAVMEVTTNVPTDVAEQKIAGLMDMAAQADAMEIEPGASIDDAAFYDALNTMIKNAGLTRDQVNACFEAMGYEVQFTPHTYDVTYLEAHQTDIKDTKAYQAMMKTAKAQIDIPDVSIITKKGGSSSGVKGNYGGSKGSSSGGSGNGGSGDDSSDNDTASEDSEETFDWIEVAIQRIEEDISRLDTVIEDVYSGWGERNDKITEKIKKLTQEIEAQTTAYEEYMNYANKKIQINDGKAPNADDYENGTSDVQYTYDKAQYDEAVSQWATGEYQKKVREGLMTGEDIEKIQNQYLVDAINAYKEYYEKAIAAQDKVKELEITKKDQYKQLFENLIEEYEDDVTNIEKKADIINERISRTEELGFFVDKSYYDKLIEYEKQKNQQYATELQKVVNQFNTAVNEGKIQKGTAAWDEMYQSVMDVNKAYEESNTELVKLNNTIRQLQWDKFDWLEERLDDISAEADWLIGLLQGEDNYNDKGFLNNRGFAQAALVGAKYNDTLEKQKRYKEQIADIDKKIASGEYNKNDKEVIARKEELLKVYRDSISAAEEEKKAMQDLVRNGISKHIEALTELIDKYKESLSDAKDLYEYQKNLTNQTKNIADLEKQLAAYQGDNSEETRKKRQELQKQLNDAQQQLQETEWDRYISETNQMLDDMKTDYEKYLNDQTESIAKVMMDMIPYINDNKTAIQNGLNEIKTEYGITTQHFENFANTQDGILSVFRNGDFASKLTSIHDVIKDFKTEMAKVTDTSNNGILGIVEKQSKDVSDIAATLGVVDSTNNPNKPKDNGSKGSKGSGEKAEDSLYGANDGTWKKDAKGDWYQYGDGSYAKNEYIDGYWLNSEGYWDSSWDGSWKRNDQGYWWEYSDGSYPTNEWLKINGDWYYFDESGYMVTGKQTIGGKSYTFGKYGDWLGYAKGTKGSPRDQLAWTQENASELIYRTSDGAMLTPLNRGDMVFTHDMSQRLWEIAKGNIPTTVGLAVPNVGSSNVRNVTSNNNITIELPNVENYDDFKREMKQDKDLEKFWQEITIGQAMGNNTLKKNKY